MRRAPVLGFSFALAVLSAAFVLLAGPVVPAGAAFPGRNGKIAYVRESVIGKDSAWTMRADGSHKRRIARNASEPAFSPSGRKIVFTRWRRNTNCHCRNGDLYTMRANGSHERRLTHTPASEVEPSFSPSGKRVVFSRHGTHSGGIYTIRVDGSHRRKLTGGFFNFDPVFSPNGRLIVFDRVCELRIMRADGSHDHALTPPVFETCDKVPDFSPDGRRIAFARDGTGSVYLIDTDGTDLTSGYAPAYYPAFSPNGRRIAFYRSHPDGASDIYSVRTDGSNVKRLTFSESGVRAIEPSWGVRP